MSGRKALGQKARTANLPSTLECIVILPRMKMEKGGKIEHIKTCLNIIRKRREKGKIVSHYNKIFGF